ncbi:MAG: glycoside hydrolase family 57 protein [Candidatus Woesearchaeota archaeon]
MVSTCFYFQVHQPFRLKKYGLFDIGMNCNYFNENKNKSIFDKVSKKCYLPANSLMQYLLEKIPEFKISYSFSGIFLEQAEKYNPKVLESFQRLVDTGKVEILSETYYHSLAFFYSKKEFKEQVRMHNKKIKEVFGFKPKVFRNTELVFNNELANFIEKMGYKGILAEGADHILRGRSPNFVYHPKTTKKIKLLLKNYKLSDDIAFRFSSQEWKEWPLNAEKFSQWVNAINGNGQTVNLFMDYETIGEHQWASTGIFGFLRRLPEELLKNPDNDFKTPSEVIQAYPSVAELDIHHPVSWADVERDMSAWLGNNMQRIAIEKLYSLEPKVLKIKDPNIIKDWRCLQISDHFYYMCTKWFNDGDVHKYFNPYDRPHDAFVSFINIFNDLQLRINEKLKV